MEKPPIISYEQINYTMNGYNLAVRAHDGMTFAIEIANCQRDADVEWCEDKIREIFEEIEKHRVAYRTQSLSVNPTADIQGWIIFPDDWQSLKDKYNKQSIGR